MVRASLLRQKTTAAWRPDMLLHVSGPDSWGTSPKHSVNSCSCTGGCSSVKQWGWNWISRCFEWRYVDGKRAPSLERYWKMSHQQLTRSLNSWSGDPIAPLWCCVRGWVCVCVCVCVYACYHHELDHFCPGPCHREIPGFYSSHHMTPVLSVGAGARDVPDYQAKASNPAQPHELWILWDLYILLEVWISFQSLFETSNIILKPMAQPTQFL